MIACEFCGSPLPPDIRSNARFCSDKHRKAAARARTAETLTAGPAPEVSSLLLAARETLQQTREPGLLGAQVLDVAERLQSVPPTSPAAASLHRELRQLVAVLALRPRREPDAVDELIARRRARQGRH